MRRGEEQEQISRKKCVVGKKSKLEGCGGMEATVWGVLLGTGILYIHTEILDPSLIPRGVKRKWDNCLVNTSCCQEMAMDVIIIFQSVSL